MKCRTYPMYKLLMNFITVNIYLLFPIEEVRNLPPWRLWSWTGAVHVLAAGPLSHPWGHPIPTVRGALQAVNLWPTYRHDTWTVNYCHYLHGIHRVCTNLWWVREKIDIIKIMNSVCVLVFYCLSLDFDLTYYLILYI